MELILILGAIAIIALSGLLAFIFIKLWLTIIKSNEKSDKKAIREIKKKEHRIFAVLLSKDRETEKRDAVIGIIALFSLLCIAALYSWFSWGASLI